MIDLPDRKFVDIVDVDDYEILTDKGWTDIECIGKTIPYQIYEVQTETHSLKCADDHIVFDSQMNEVFVKDLVVGQMIQTDNGLEKVIDVIQHDEYDSMYDIQVNNDDHRYFTDGILSHNSTMYCIYALWVTTFFPEKKVMLLANKAATALELLGRITTGYEYLPKWLKAPVIVVNKGELTFSNMSSIRAFASSSDAARGFSCNCVDANTSIVIRFKAIPSIKLKVKIGTLKKIAIAMNSICRGIHKVKCKIFKTSSYN